MKNKCTIHPRRYILTHLVWLITAMIWYRNVFFVPISGTTVAQSKMILWIAVPILTALGCAVTFKKRRNRLSVFANVLLPYELYAIVTYWTIYPKLILVTALLNSLAALLFIVLGLLPDANNEKRTAAQRKRQAQHSLHGVRLITAICLLGMLIPVGIRVIFGHGLISTKVQPVKTASSAEEWTVQNQIDTVQLLQEGKWAGLEPQQKLDVLGTVVNIEIRYLGLNHELYLTSGTLGDNVAAHYNPRDHEIVIDITQLQTAAAADLLDSLCHECYHSYQYQIIELYESTPEEYRNMLLFQYVDTYINEFSDYNDGSENILDYYLQTTEIQARRYAEMSVEDYYNRIIDCLQSAN